ncbi:MAG: MBL fold metallo-hydrolase [Lachnospiraceae bacterium]|nr:MBL fold metallo-hydrolase [Lachnospiraceae bacterium]
MKKQKNLALISLILGIVGCLTGVVLVGAVFGIAAIVLGMMSAGSSKNAKDRRRSQIGIITGAVAIAYTAVLYAWVGLHPPVTPKEPLLPETTMSGAQQAGGTESTAPVVTVTPTATPKPTAKVVPTTRPTQKPTAAPTARPTQEPTATPTARPTQTPTAAPTARPTQEPTAAPTQEPTAAPTKSPTQEPTAVPTQTPTTEPTKEPTKTPAQTPTKTPDTQEEENKESPNAGNPGMDSGKTEQDSGSTDSGKTGTDSGKTDSGKAGTDSGSTDSGKAGTDSGKTDSGKSDTDSEKTESGKTDTESGKTDSGTESKPETKALLKIHFLDVGQGACALIESDGHYMLIDGGGRDASSFTVSYLEQLKIGKFDYMVATHFDEDHIAGLVGVLHKFKVGTVLEPSYKVDTNIYTSFKEAEKNSGAEVIIPEPGDVYTLGDAEFTILAPKKPENTGDTETLPEGSSGNNQSICILLKNGENKVLFTGDAEQEEEQYLVESGRDIRADVYMVGHHGSSSSSSALLLDAVKPKYGVISCGKGNDYGHPTQELLDRLWDKDVSVFRTDEQGNIIMTSDGKKITWSTSPSETWAPGVIPEKAPDRSGDTDSAVNTDTGADGSSETAENMYVLNNNSMKFHHPWCKSVEKISAKNYGESSLSRDELIAQGYSPCGNCNP